MTENTDYKPRQIDLALIKVIQATANIPKTGWNKTGGYEFTKADDVYAKVRVALAENGVLFFARPTSIVHGGEYESGTRAPIFTTTIDWDMAFTAVGDGTSEHFVWQSTAFDKGDKSFSKAVTDGIKLFLKAQLLLAPEPGEDSDESNVARAPRESLVTDTGIIDVPTAYDKCANHPQITLSPNHEASNHEGRPITEIIEEVKANLSQLAAPASEAQVSEAQVSEAQVSEALDLGANTKPKPEISIWPKETEPTILKSEKWAAYRQVCANKHREPIDTAKEAFEEGCRNREEFIEYVSSLSNIGPIEIVTLNTIEELLDKHGLRSARRISKAGQDVIRMALGLSGDGSLPLMRELKEGDAERLIRFIEDKYSSPITA